MSKVIRVHSLAKELNVSSKDILEKCRAEGIELPGHMAPVKVGLAESIREWFKAAGEHHTAIETALPVDVEKLHKPRRSSKKKTASESEADDAAVAVESAPRTEPESEAALTSKIEPTAEPAMTPVAPPVTPTFAPVVEEPVLLPVSTPEPEIAPAQPEPLRPAAKAPSETSEVRSKPVEHVAPSKQIPVPPPAMPVGPRHVPKPAELRGPRVVRIEAPDPVARPRPRQSNEPWTPAARGPAPAAPAPSTAPSRGGRGKTKAEEDKETIKSRARSPRRQGRGAEVVERIVEWRQQDMLERKERLASATGHGIHARRVAEKRKQTGPSGPVEKKVRTAVEMEGPIILKTLCATIGQPFIAVLARLKEHTGNIFSINQTIDDQLAELITLDFGLTLTVTQPKTQLERMLEKRSTLPREHIKPRPPVVTMLGHVDHGKTSLLDAIRRTDVASKEAGGITQHIGAYRVDRNDWHVTFLDTPGHEAFTAMRARGANLTDVVVLVVAAPEGLMPQTIEAINHAKAANVQIVVALNKVDLPGWDINRVYSQLSEHGLTPSEWGGSTDVLKTSATKATGIDEMIAHLSTLSELLSLKADTKVPAHASVIEAQRREGRGVVVHVLVREGTLKPGQIVVCGPGFGKVRSLLDDKGKRLESAEPGTPAEVVGLDELPMAGDQLYVVSTLDEAEEIAEETRLLRRNAALQARVRKPITLESIMTSGTGEVLPELNVILKADVQGSMESLRKLLSDFPTGKALMRLLHTGIGMISQADVTLAQASKAIIIGFNVVADDRAAALADEVGVEIRTYRVVYEIKEDLTKAMEGLLAPLEQRAQKARVEVRQVFSLSKAGTVAGSFVLEGTIVRSHRVRIVRDGRIVADDLKIQSLRRIKDDVREVRAGLECGVKLENFNDFKPGDILEAFEVTEVAQRL